MANVTFGIEFEGFFIFSDGSINTQFAPSCVNRPFARLRDWNRQNDHTAGFEISTPVYDNLTYAYKDINRNFAYWLRCNRGVAPLFFSVRGTSLGQHVHFGIEEINLEYDIEYRYGDDAKYHIKNILASHIIRFYPLFMAINCNPVPSRRMRNTNYAIPLYRYTSSRYGLYLNVDHYAEISDSSHRTIECRIFDANIPQVALTNIYLISNLLKVAYDDYIKRGDDALYNLNWNLYKAHRCNAIERGLLGIDTYGYLNNYIQYVGDIELPDIPSIKELLYLACKYRINAYQLFHRLFGNNYNAWYHYFRRLSCNSHKYFDILLEDTFNEYINDEYKEKIENWKNEAHQLNNLSECLELLRYSQLIVLEKIRQISRPIKITRPQIRQLINNNRYVVSRIFELSGYTTDDVANAIAYLVNHHGDGFTNEISSDYVINANERFYVLAVRLPNSEQYTIVGTIAIRIRTGEIMHLVVDRRYRGLGIGKILVKHVINVAKENGLTSVYAWIKNDNSTSKRLFESLGFTEHDRSSRAILYRLDLGGD